MVPQSRNTRGGSGQNSSSDSKADSGFAAVLESAVKKEDRPSMNCHTCTYGANLKLQNFLYQVKEYTY